MLKKVMIFLIIAALLLTAAGCGIRKRMEKKAQEKASESILKGIFGDDVDIDENGIKIKGTEGEIEFGFGEWPKDKAGKLLPKYGSGKIVSVANTDTSCIITIEDVKDSSYDEYIKKLNKEGFKEDEMEADYENMKTYCANRSKDNSQASITFMTDDKIVTVAIYLD